ncbi:MAG: hypothetical protein J6S26_01465 [Solobacterium sp.]|nr:hypothetical protein [Solobacterium sp.]
MELDLFAFIEEAMNIYDLRKTSFEYAENVLCAYFEDLQEHSDSEIVSVHSRVKSRDSLREKLLRNKFYLTCNDPMEAITSLSDLVGVTLECRFIRNELELYKNLKREFSEPNEDGFAICLNNADILLNLGMPQPQVQRNGFAIYRLDGKYRFNDIYIGFELQIKSLVHRFWSEIEHEVVYKNQEMVRNDTFMKKMLSSIRDSLDVVDHQLESVYTEMLMESREAEIGMDERTFKAMVSSSLNELFIRKMRESVGFSTSFKHDSEILAQYVFITYFLYGSNPEAKMVEFLEGLNQLSETEIDFRMKLEYTPTIVPGNSFVKILSEYFLSVMNVDFQWHAFFTILSAMESGNVYEDIVKFTAVIHRLLIQQSWYEERFAYWPKEDAIRARQFFETAFADAMVKTNSIHMIHETYILGLMNWFWALIGRAEELYDDYAHIEENRDRIISVMNRDVANIIRRTRE